jgi:hypothetical protein
VSQLDDIIAAVRHRAAAISERDEQFRPDLGALLVSAIGTAMLEIRRGAPSDEFKELTVLHFIQLGDQAGYTSDELRPFLQDVKTGEEDDEDDALAEES